MSPTLPPSSSTCSRRVMASSFAAGTWNFGAGRLDVASIRAARERSSLSFSRSSSSSGGGGGADLGGVAFGCGEESVRLVDVAEVLGRTPVLTARDVPVADALATVPPDALEADAPLAPGR